EPGDGRSLRCDDYGCSRDGLCDAMSMRPLAEQAVLRWLTCEVRIQRSGAAAGQPRMLRNRNGTVDGPDDTEWTDSVRGSAGVAWFRRSGGQREPDIFVSMRRV